LGVFFKGGIGVFLKKGCFDLEKGLFSISKRVVLNRKTGCFQKA
jgi:hypothetical protein